MVHAFFIGRALATIVGERVEQAMTDSLSALGRFDAEQRENLRQFTEEVMERARREEETSGQAAPSTDAAPYPAAESADLRCVFLVFSSLTTAVLIFCRQLIAPVV